MIHVLCTLCNRPIHAIMHIDAVNAGIAILYIAIVYIFKICEKKAISLELLNREKWLTTCWIRN